MKESIPVADDFFQTDGTLKADAPSYIDRLADRELYECVLAGSYAYVLTPRQMGKSSLMTRTAAKLRAEGIHVAVLDLTGIGGDVRSMTADQWYFGLANKMLSQLNISYALVAWWQEQILLPPLNRLMNFFQDVLLNQLEGNIVVFVDEIDTTINLPFSDDFFAAIRACFNARANQAVFDRICFVLLGVASPADLIRDPTRTPFNIGKRIDLTDFDVNEARHFMRGLHENPDDAERLLKRILYWTGGHPYLTQKLCDLAQSNAANETPETRVDSIVKTEFLGLGQRTKEGNLKLIDDRIVKTEEHKTELLKVYAKVRKGKRVQDQPQSSIYSTIKLSGLVKTDQLGRLRVRNEIYKQVFDARWINQLTPSRWPQRVAVASVVIPAVLFSWWIGSQQLTLTSAKGILLAWLGVAYPEPEMVEITAGSFLMGSPASEKGRGVDEIQQQVSIKQNFYMGAHEVTFDEYDVFAFLIKLDGGCADGHEVIHPSDNGWGRGKLPVINVSWQDAQCYAEWLVKKTGKNYRLPTEAEWEYAARAGTSTAYSWGDEASHDNANYGTEECCDGLVSGKDKWLYTSPVGSFPANAFGLYDMAGNVWEWTCSDYVKIYDSNEQGCHSNNDTGSAVRSLRGGSLDNNSSAIRSAGRYRFVATNRRYVLGFRLALGSPPVKAPPPLPCIDTKAVPSSPTSTMPAIAMAAIKSGCFLMGSPETEPERVKDAKQHQICVKNFEIAKYEVTQALWQAVMGNNPSYCKGDKLPVESVSWNEAQEFIRKLNQLTGEKYRLPSEAEWEYAARAGTTTTFYTGNCINTHQANFDGNYNYNNCGKGASKNQTVAIGSYQPNPWGLYDMAGNVWEWTCSEYAEIYEGSEMECKSNSNTSSMIVMRGGSWSWDSRFVRSADRHKLDADYHDIDVGFRLARDLK